MWLTSSNCGGYDTSTMEHVLKLASANAAFLFSQNESMLLGKV